MKQQGKQSPSNISLTAKFQGEDLARMREFADENPNFDDTFLSSLENFFLDRKYLTDKQYSALLNVMDKWGVG